MYIPGCVLQRLRYLKTRSFSMQLLPAFRLNVHLLAENGKFVFLLKRTGFAVGTGGVGWAKAVFAHAGSVGVRHSVIATACAIPMCVAIAHPTQ
jgi:hypothetical protein